MASIIHINTDPSRRTLNQFGFIWMGFLSLFGTLAFFKFGQTEAAVVLWSLAIVVPVIGWMIPGFMRVIFLGMSYAAWPIGFVVSHVVLAVVYYGVLTPIGLVMRMIGYDPMTREIDPAADSYWTDRATATRDPKSYFRQF